LPSQINVWNDIVVPFSKLHFFNRRIMQNNSPLVLFFEGLMFDLAS